MKLTPFLADHAPHELVAESRYLVSIVVLVVLVMAAVWVLGGRDRPSAKRLLLGLAVATSAIVPALTWGYCVGSFQIALLGVVLAVPALVVLAIGQQPLRLRAMVFVGVAVVIAAVFVRGQASGCWRQDSYIRDEANLYTVVIMIPMLASWLLALRESGRGTDAA